jgi:hypothetical protein
MEREMERQERKREGVRGEGEGGREGGREREREGNLLVVKPEFLLGGRQCVHSLQMVQVTSLALLLRRVFTWLGWLPRLYAAQHGSTEIQCEAVLVSPPKE